MLENEEIGIPCAQCGFETKKKIGWIKTHSDFICTCGAEVYLEADKFRAKIAEIEKLFAGLSKRITLKF